MRRRRSTLPHVNGRHQSAWPASRFRLPFGDGLDSVVVVVVVVVVVLFWLLLLLVMLLLLLLFLVMLLPSLFSPESR